MLGFAVAAIISIPLTLVIASVPIVERAVYPLLVFFQLIPKLAFAPLFVVWFGFTASQNIADISSAFLSSLGRQHDRLESA